MSAADGRAITPRGPVVIDVGAVQARQMIVGSVVAGVFGLLAVAGALTGDVSGGTGTRAGVMAFGLVFCLFALLPLILRRIAFRPRRLVFDADGVRWDDPRGTTWSVGWADLAEITLTYPPPAAEGGKLASRVNLTLRPADPAFREAHPEMEHLIVPGGHEVRYRLPLGHAQPVVGPADRALRRCAAGIYIRNGPEIPAPRDRPRAVKLSVAFIAGHWAYLMAIPLVNDGDDPATLGLVLGWTALVALLLSRVWAGGAFAVARTAQLALMFGVLGLLLQGLLAAAVLATPDEASGRLLLGLPTGLATTTGLLASGWLLARKDVRAWVASRAWGL
ncbi:MAG TPA: hypothetical protein VIL71_13840 [Spirillospora sp.]